MTSSIAPIAAKRSMTDAQSDTGAKDRAELRRQVERHTIELLALASKHFRVKLTLPVIRFDLRGKSAGQVRTSAGSDCVIRYNPRLLERHPQEFLAQTVPHEAAHLLAFSLFGPRIAPHGREWRAMMAFFGVPPERCHQFSVEGLQARRLRRYAYRCACRTHQITSIRHNRIRSGQTYLCRQCGRALEPVPAKPASEKPE